MASKLPIQDCREILGHSADRMTDEQIENLRDEVDCLANVMYEEFVKRGPDGLEVARWDSHFRLTGRGE